MPVRSFLLAAVLAALFLALPPGTRAEDLANPRCPVRPDEASLSSFQIEHEGKTVSFCCKDCVTTFEEDPGPYLKELPQFANAHRPAWRQTLDQAWNTGLRYPGLALGLLAFAGITLGQGFLALAGIRGWPRRALAAAGSAKGLAAIAILAFAGEALGAHLGRLAAENATREKELEEWIHFATFTDYGDPPVPAPPGHSRRMELTYYRGNDERSELLFNGGFYRTATFDLSVCRSDGIALQHGDPTPPCDDLFLKVVITRAPGTPDYFWTPERMDLMFATRESGRFLGRFEPVADATPLRPLESMRQWEIRYPLAGFASPDKDDRFAGIVYLCEKRFDADRSLVGGRFHYAFQFDLDHGGKQIQPDSAVWMGALYRSRILRIWQIPEREWLSTEPIPEIENGHQTKDPDVLGITGHEEDRN